MPCSTASSGLTGCAKSLGWPSGGGDHFAQRPFLEKADLAKLLFAHLFIRCALQFFGPGLVDDMGDFLFGELATELLLPDV